MGWPCGTGGCPRQPPPYPSSVALHRIKSCKDAFLTPSWMRHKSQTCGSAEGIKQTQSRRCQAFLQKASLLFSQSTDFNKKWKAFWPCWVFLAGKRQAFSIFSFLIKIASSFFFSIKRHALPEQKKQSVLQAALPSFFHLVKTFPMADF